MWVFLKGWWDAYRGWFSNPWCVHVFFHRPTFRESGYSQNVEWTRRYHVSAKKELIAGHMLPPSITENCQNVHLRTTFLGAGYPFDWTMFLNWSRWWFQRLFIVSPLFFLGGWTDFFCVQSAPIFQDSPAGAKNSFDWGWVARKNHDRGGFRIPRKHRYVRVPFQLELHGYRAYVKGNPPRMVQTPGFGILAVTSCWSFVLVSL